MNPVIEIITNNVEALALPSENGKWCGVIAYTNAPHDPILTSVPIYDSEQAARDGMLEEIKSIREFATWCDENPISQ